MHKENDTNQLNVNYQTERNLFSELCCQFCAPRLRKCSGASGPIYDFIRPADFLVLLCRLCVKYFLHCHTDATNSTRQKDPAKWGPANGLSTAFQVRRLFRASRHANSRRKPESDFPLDMRSSTCRGHLRCSFRNPTSEINQTKSMFNPFHQGLFAFTHMIMFFCF